MCSANVDIYTHVWTDAFYQPLAHFEVDHQRRDFGAILDWQEENSYKMKDFKDMRRPKDTPERRMTRKFKELHGYYAAFPDKVNEETGSTIG
jgi:hypothetical protein